MKLIGSKVENEYRNELISSRRALFEKNEYQRLLSSLILKYPDMRTAYIMNWTPEQGEDIYRLLIDTNMIIGVEIDRYDLECLPSVEKFSFKEYERSLSKTGRIKLSVALELAKSDIENHD